MPLAEIVIWILLGIAFGFLLIYVINKLCGQLPIEAPKEWQKAADETEEKNKSNDK